MDFLVLFSLILINLSKSAIKYLSRAVYSNEKIGYMIPQKPNIYFITLTSVRIILDNTQLL